MKKLFIISFILVLMIGVVGCTNGELKKVEEQDPATVDEVKKQDEDIEEPEQEQEPDQEKVELAKIGDTLEINGIRVTLTDVKRYEGKINPYNPLENDHVIEIDMVVENTTSETVFVDNTDFKLYDENDFEVKSALPSGDIPLMDEISGGKKIKGKIYFDVPVQEGNFELIYSQFLSDIEAKYEIPYK